MTLKFLSRRGTIVVFGLFAISLSLASCLKNNDDYNTPTNVAGLMAFNLVPDQEAVNIGLSGNLVPGSPFSYSNFTGRYVNIFPGDRLIQSANAVTGTALDSSNHIFEPNKYYSLFVVGSNGSYKNIVSEDKFDSLTASSGKAYVRFINALSASPSSTVSITADGASVLNKSAGFGEVSEFTGITPGEITINVTNESSPAVSRTISVSQEKAYTVLLTGLPNQSDSTKAVQIKFIENGTITD